MKDIQVILYSANWCGHCTRFAPIWQDFNTMIKNKNINNDIKNNYNINLTTKKYLDTSKQTKIAQIGGFPTIHIVEDNKINDYKGERTIHSLFKTILNADNDVINKWISQSNIQNGGNKNINYFRKYLKYKEKYLLSKNK
jgi:protein disulfide-isomerase